MKRLGCMLLALALCFAAALAESYDIGAGVTLELDAGSYLLIASPQATDGDLQAVGLTEELLRQAMEGAPTALIAFAEGGAALYAIAEEDDGAAWAALDDEALAAAYAGLDEGLNGAAGENGSFTLASCAVEAVPFGRAVVLELRGEWFGEETALLRAVAQGGKARVTLSLVVPGPADDAERALLDAALNGLREAEESNDKEPS